MTTQEKDDVTPVLEFGNRLKEIRVRLDETQPGLAAKLGCKRQTLSSWEQGQTTPDVKSLLRLKEVARNNERSPVDLDLGELLGERKVDSGATPLDYAIRLLKKIDVMGIRDVHPSRSEALIAFLPFLEAEQKSISIVASSFLGASRAAPGRVATVLARKVNEVKQFRILLTDPVMSGGREKQERRSKGTIEMEIKESLELLETWGVKKENIKFWRGAPSIFLMFTSERMIANPYTYTLEAFKSVTFEIAPTGSSEDVFSQYSLNHFTRPWESNDPELVSDARSAKANDFKGGQVKKRRAAE